MLSPVVELLNIAENVYVERMVNKMMNIRAIGNKEQFISNDRLMGRSMIMLSTIGFGTIGMFSKFAYASGIDAPLLLALRFLVAAVALWFYFLVFNRDGIRISQKRACHLRGAWACGLRHILDSALQSVRDDTGFDCQPALFQLSGLRVNTRLDSYKRAT